MLGFGTVRALDGEKHDRAAFAHECGRHLWPIWSAGAGSRADLGNPHVIVNVPDYTLTLYNDGKVYWHTKMVVGEPGKATPMISAEMKFITVDPTWNVPPSIIENEYLPALQQDPDALDRIGLKMGRTRTAPCTFSAAGSGRCARPHPLRLPR